MRSWLLVVLGVVLSVLIVFGVIYSQKLSSPTAEVPSTSMPNIAQTATANPISSSTPTPEASASPGPGSSLSTASSPSATNLNPDLTVDANGLSKATVIMTTSEGTIKFKFYSNDAPKTVKRIIELINKGFYNGLTFHRVVPGFVIQGGDPVGNGTGGSGQKLDAEFMADIT